ncbi:T6SS immunity protein Tli4 family protein [Pseudomonas chlororaphis]|uniref:T6SS immunity protein Tli4 family protein n=1 Tax=Pseudomonas chlororaphis TaxID=587753 RepID=UPI0024084B0D|nr:T6SS immunity protein Tli4 family protein [Pseudomonas chlororaphis]
MMRRRQFFAVLGMVALTSITSCTSFSSSRNPSMDKTGWITHCFGRFLIDLPPQAEIRAGYYLWGDNIEALDETPVTLATRVDQTEQELKSQLHRRAQGSMFLRRLDLGGSSTGLLSWKSNASTEMYLLDTYAISKPTWRAYRWMGGVTRDRESQGIESATSLAYSLRSREADEIPSEPGFCIDRAYIAGNSFQGERFDIGVTFPDHPGAHFEFTSSTGAEEDRLLDRVGGFLAGAARAVAGIETLRKRERGGPVPADEYLLAGTDKGQRIYTFAWEAQGKDDSITEPNISAALGVLERSPDSSGKLPAPPFQSDKEALELWDTIIGSIRLRPVSSAPRGSNAGSPAPTAPTGNTKAVDDDYAIERFLADLKPNNSWMDEL